MDMFESLLTQPSGKSVGPELLEMLGRKASTMFQQKGVPLNQAIAQVTADHPELGNEHIKRVVEFANTVTFQEMFQKEPDKNVHFEVADPGVVLRDLKDGGSPAHDGKTLQGGLGDYRGSPKLEHEAGGMEDLEHLFSTRPSSSEHTTEQGANEWAGQQKTASAPTDPALHANPIDDVYDTHLRLQAARSELAGAHEQFDLMVKEARESLFQVVQDESLSPDGAGLGGVLAVLEKVASKEVITDTLAPVIEKMASDPRSLPKLEAGLEKTAGRVVNMEHPLIKAWAGLEKAASDQVRTAEGLREVDSLLAETSEFLKSAGRPVTNKIRSMVGRIAATRQRFGKSHSR
jgi:hypothetical protein